MEADEERRAVDGVVADLARTFPDVPRAVLVQYVTEGYRAFEDAPIRDYIAVIVRREARARVAILVEESRSRFDRPAFHFSRDTAHS
ncbi:MAG TPA: hypothetical protein VGM94_03325 [Galbitalea sp.]